MQDTVWVCEDGRKLLVSNMETSHVSCCVLLIEMSVAAGRPWRARYLERLRLELTIRSLGGR